MELLEREALLASLDDWLVDAAAGAGHLVAVAGEAGAGKSALLRAFVAAHADDPLDVRWGACDPLTTPRPLGALQDISVVGSPLAHAIAGGRPPAMLFALLHDELRVASRPTVVVVEDAHWADEATFDLLRYFGRRVSDVPALLVVTFRDDECGPNHPLRVALGDLAGAPALRRLTVPLLSEDAVTRIAVAHGLDGSALYRKTCGNAFFVSEVVAAVPEAMPDSVREAVLARANRLSADARAVLDAASLVPVRAEPWLLIGSVGAAGACLDACLASGMLVADADGVRFRHEIARLAVASALPPGRRLELHRRLLEVLRSAVPVPDPARLAHHAAAAGDGPAVVCYARLAGDRAAALGAHREAAAHYAAVLEHAGDLEPVARAELLERRSYECYLTDQLCEAVSAREEALECWRAAGDARRVGDTLRWLSRLYWFVARNREAVDAAHDAVAVLEGEPVSRELAMAYSNLAQLAMLAEDAAAAQEWGSRAVALGEEIGDVEVVVHALNNMGAAQMESGDESGRAVLERSLAIAVEHGMEEHVARAYTNLMSTAVRHRDVGRARSYGAAGIAYCMDRDLDALRWYMTSWSARLALDLDDWGVAVATAEDVLRHEVSPVTRVMALMVLGRIRARRGQPDAMASLEAAFDIAAAMGERQRLVPAAVAYAEAAWLSGTADLPHDVLLALKLAPDVQNPWERGELAVWAMRLGRPADVDPDARVPYFDSIEGRPAAAADRWLASGRRYEAALAALDGDDVERIRQAVEALTALGATAAVSRATHRLRALGVTAVRGPRATTAANPAGLTVREVEVLTLVAEGLPNSSIAERLVVSPRTVHHHVSAVLRKLGVASRAEAARVAVKLGIAAAST